MSYIMNPTRLSWHKTISASLMAGTFLMSVPLMLSLAQAQTAPNTQTADKTEHKSTQTPAPHSAEEKVTVVGVRQPRPLDQLGTSGQFVTAKQLRQKQVRDTNDLGRVLPGVQIQNNSSFLFPAITVRGITSAQDFYHPATTFYLDDVPILPINAMQPLMDATSVQLLRGPQVALYGQSAEGGVIDITTRQPDETPHAAFSGGAESRYGYHVNATADGRLIKDWLYGSIAGLSQAQQGNLTNPATNAKRQGGFSSYGGRGSLRLAPTGQPWEIDASVDGSCTYSSQYLFVNFDNFASRTVSSAVPGTPNPHINRCGHDEYLRGLYHFNGWKLSAITSWQNSKTDVLFPYYSFISTQPEQWRANTQELRLGTEGKHSFYDIVSGFYHQTTYQNRTSQFAAYVPQYIPYPITTSHNRAETLALYGNVYWHILKNLDLGTGGRLSRDTSRINFNSLYGSYPLFSGQGNRSQNMALGNVSLDYEALKGLHFHSRVSQGYKPAGFNFAPTGPGDAQSYNAERETSYEFSTLYHQKTFFIRAGYFYNHLTNEQIYVGMPPNMTIVSAGRAHASGVEGEASWEFHPGWTISADGNRTSSKFNRFSDNSGMNYAGLFMPYVPKFMAAGHLSGRFDTHIGRFEPGIDLRVTGPQYFDIANHFKQPTYAQLDLRTTWSLGTHYDVTIYANNVTNKLYRTYATSNFAQINYGRTVGFSLRASLSEMHP